MKRKGSTLIILNVVFLRNRKEKVDRMRDVRSMFKDKVLLITGGTGSFGNTVVKAFLHQGLKEIRIFSRDEKNESPFFG